MMTGTLLGDRSLVKKPYHTGGTYYKFRQSVKHYDYLIHIFTLFKDLGYLNILFPNKGYSTIKEKKYEWYQFNTKSVKEWNDLYFSWYVKGVKLIPENIESLLTPVRLAYWFIDDGGWTGKRIHLATNRYTPEHTILLIKNLESKYCLKCTLHQRNRIYIWVDSSTKFIELIKPYMHSGISHKLQQK